VDYNAIAALTIEADKNVFKVNDAIFAVSSPAEKDSWLSEIKQAAATLGNPSHPREKLGNRSDSFSLVSKMQATNLGRPSLSLSQPSPVSSPSFERRTLGVSTSQASLVASSTASLSSVQEEWKEVTTAEVSVLKISDLLNNRGENTITTPQQKVWWKIIIAI
jgi:hypothetical protein